MQNMNDELSNVISTRSDDDLEEYMVVIASKLSDTNWCNQV